jgi:death-on-curing protein
MIFLKKESVLKIHAKQIELFGGSLGIREIGLLESAIAMPNASFGGDFLHENIFLMAAAYLFHISKNHPFVDGNKRTAFVCMDVFLRINGYKLKSDTKSLEKLVIDTVTGKLSKNDIADFLRKNSRKI